MKLALRIPFAFVATVLAVCLGAAALAAPSAKALEVIDYFGSSEGSGALGGEFNNATGVAVNYTGAGPAAPGDVYAVDTGNNRVQRFSYDDNGTPADPYDDSYDFVSAWGADVVQPGGTGDQGDESDADFEICTVASECKAGVASGGNGTQGGNGALFNSRGIAVDQDTGRVYVSDGTVLVSGTNARISVYEGDGAFLFSFGWDVVESGLGDTAADEYEVCAHADGDVCKAGIAGGGLGQLNRSQGIAVSPPDNSASTGKIYLADSGNSRVNTYSLDGSALGSFGSAAEFLTAGPAQIAVDSRGIVYANAASAGSVTVEIQRYDTENANGDGVGFLTPIGAPPLPEYQAQLFGLAVDPDSDGAGSDADVLYSIRSTNSGPPGVIQQFGPGNAPGLGPSPLAADAEHGSLVGFGRVGSVDVDPESSRLFVTSHQTGEAPINSPPDRHGVYVLGPAGGIPTASLDSLSDVTSTSVTLNATVNPNGGPPVAYRPEYSTNGVDWTPVASTVLGTQSTPQSVSALLDPPPTGLEPSTEYHVRLAANKEFTPPVFTGATTFTTLPESPDPETTGAPHRTTTTAELTGRVNPRNTAATYHFEYGTQGPCSANPCETTSSLAAGSDNQVHLVAETIEGLDPDTTYHYRLVADNGVGGPVAGEDRMVRTRASDELPSQNSEFPGPPGSDRGWEMISAPDTGGNPAESATISDDGNRSVYLLLGGTPTSETGGFNQFYAERIASGWQTRTGVYPERSQLPGTSWLGPFGPPDLSEYVALNGSTTGEGAALFRISPGSSAEKLHQASAADQAAGSVFDAVVSQNGSTALWILPGSHDPAHPEPPGTYNLYDVSSGSPEMVNLLPGDAVPACGIPFGSVSAFSFTTDPDRHTVSPDGSLVFFPSAGDSCGGQVQLYVRDLLAGETRRVDAPPASGADCGDVFISSTVDAAFFWTKSRLVAADLAPAGGCGGGNADGDVYRYDLASEAVECLTCLFPGFATDIEIGDAGSNVLVAEDESRIYFRSSESLLPGAEPGGIYRLDPATDELAYVANLGGGLGDTVSLASATPDGSILAFRSSHPSLNPLGDDAGNDGSTQYYRYDDTDRSLVCISCPPDGSAPAGNTLDVAPPTDDGGTIAFATPSPLVPIDQNTPGAAADPAGGTDVYEWRDGRWILVTDGATTWEGIVPVLQDITPSGSDILFTVAARYTADALDGFDRVYTAKIDGGFSFPEPPPPCPLEVCQGTPAGAPDDPLPASLTFGGLGNPVASRDCGQAVRRVKRFARQARRFAVRAKRARRSARGSNSRRARAMRRRARRLGAAARRRAAMAKKQRNRVRRCRATARRTAR